MNAFKTLGGAAIALTLGFGGLAMAAPAIADDAVPVETTQEVAPSPVIEATAPSTALPAAEEAPTPPTVAPDTTPIVVSTPVQPTEPATPDTQVVTSSSTSERLSVSYHAALWEAALNLNPKFPQSLVHDGLTTSTDVHQFDSFGTKCNTTYQFDLYADDAKTNELIKDGVLNGNEESWVGGSYKGEYSNVFTTAACPPPVVQPIACVTTGGFNSDEGDLAPTQTAAGLEFDGPHTLAMDTYQRVSAGNMQGLTGMTVTYANGNSGFQALVNVEVNPNADLGSGVKHYATISSVLSDAQVDGTYNVQDGLWYTNKIAYSAPGGMNHPISWAAMTALMPNNTLLSAPSLHQQTQTGKDAKSVVTALSSSCGSTNFVPVQPEPTTRQTVVVGETVCFTNEDGTFPGGGSFNTVTTNFSTPSVWDAETHGYIPGEEVVTSENTVTTKVDAKVCPATVIPPVEPPVVVTPPATVTPPVTVVHAVVPTSDILAFTGANAVPAGLIAFALLASGGIIIWSSRKRIKNDDAQL